MLACGTGQMGNRPGVLAFPEGPGSEYVIRFSCKPINNIKCDLRTDSQSVAQLLRQYNYLFLVDKYKSEQKQQP